MSESDWKLIRPVKLQIYESSCETEIDHCAMLNGINNIRGSVGEANNYAY